MNNEKHITDAMHWIDNQININPYSEISISFIIHSGRIKRIQRTLTEKIQPEEKTNG